MKWEFFLKGPIRKIAYCLALTSSGFFLVNLQTSFAFDIEKTSPDFQYVAKVLGIDQNPQALENLQLSWPRLEEALHSLQAPLQEFLKMKNKISRHRLKTTGTEILAQFNIGLALGLQVEAGLGYHDKNLRTGGHLRFGMRILGIPTDCVCIGCAVALGTRKYRLAHSNEVTTGTVDTTGGAGFLGVGVSTFETSQKQKGPKLKEGSFGAGLLLSGGDNFAGRGFGIPLLFTFKSWDARRIEKLDKLFNAIIRDFHFLRIHEVVQKIAAFSAQVNEMKSRLKPRFKKENSQQPTEELSHSATNLQRLFEPTAVQASWRVENPKRAKALNCFIPVKLLEIGALK